MEVILVDLATACHAPYRRSNMYVRAKQRIEWITPTKMEYLDSRR